MSEHEKQLIVFDVDGTLTESKSDIDRETADVFCRLLEHFRVAIISGGTFTQLKGQVVDRLPCDGVSSLYILPTSGASMYTYTEGEWVPVYTETLREEERAHIIRAIEDAIEKTEKQAPEEIFGERIEDRGTQITFSGLGQEAPLDLKERWDPDQTKRKELQQILEDTLPGYRVGIGGSTSIDITKEGRDKGYGIQKLIDHLRLSTSDVLFIGDKLLPGGNDYPARTIGIDCMETEGPEETRRIIKNILAS